MKTILTLTLLLITALAAPTSAAGVKLFVFDCGRIAFDDVSAFGLVEILRGG